ILPLKHRDYLSRLATFARTTACLFPSGLLSLERVLGRDGLLSCSVLHCRALGLTFRFRFRYFAQALDALPDLADARFGGLERCNWLHARQAVPDRDQPVWRPCGGQLAQFLLAAEGVERSGGRGDCLLGCGE